MAEHPGTIYMNEHDRDQQDDLARKLTEKGVRNLFKKDGELNRSALVRFMVAFVDKAISNVNAK